MFWIELDHVVTDYQACTCMWEHTWLEEEKKEQEESGGNVVLVTVTTAVVGAPWILPARIQAHTLHAPLLSSQGQSPDVGTLTLSILLKETEVWAFKYHSKGRTSGMITAWIGTKVCPWIFSFYAILQDSCFYLLLWLYPAGPLVHTAKHKTGLTAGQNW